MKRYLSLHPFLFAIYPVLFLWGHNKDFIGFSQVWKPLMTIIFFTLLFFLIVRLLLRNTLKAGITTSLLIFVFSAYMQIYKFFRLPIFEEILLIRHRMLIPPLAATLIYALWKIISTKTDLKNLNIFFNIVGVVLIVTPIIQIVGYNLTTLPGIYGVPDRESLNFTCKNKTGLPDIYYIILDEYARADTLEYHYNFDNNDFLNGLEERGFFIINESRSNYGQTHLSLASSLNMRYLNGVKNIYGESDDRGPLRDLINNNLVHELLERQGYEIISFTSQISGIELTNVDWYIESALKMNQFNFLLLDSTPIPTASRFFARFIPVKPIDHTETVRDMLNYLFDNMASLRKIENPIFVFIHMEVPHPPYIFGRDGEHVILGVKPEKELYIDQLIYVNKKTLTAIDDILSYSDRPVIIIIQADHGPGSEELDEQGNNESFLNVRYNILNAIYLPDMDGEQEIFSRNQTPVNTFRIIFDRYFGTNFEILDDKSYYSPWPHPYQLKPINFEES